MGRSTPSILRPAGGLAAALLVAVVCITFITLRFTADSAFALALSQVVFLTAPAAAAVLAAVAAFRAPSRSRAAMVWGLLAVATALVTVSEGIYAANTVLGFQATGPAGSAADIINLMGVLMLLGVLATVAQLDTLGAKRLAQLLLDVVIVLVLSFTLVYRFGISPLMAAGDAESIVNAVRHAIYSSVGIGMVVGVVFCMIGVRGRARVWDVLLFSGLFVFSLGVALWPLWSLAAEASAVLGPLAEPLMTLLYLLGYCLTALAGLVRIRSADESWQIAVSFQRPRLVWPGMVSATLVFAAVGLLAWSVLKPSSGAADQIVYFLGVSMAAVCMVGRTALTAIELDEARETSVTDSLTGALNTRGLSDGIERLLANKRRNGEPFAIAMVDVDDLDVINRKHGPAAGDAILTELAGVLAVAAGSREHVFRLSGDEFAVLMPGADSSAAEAGAQRLIAAVDVARPTERAVTVSVGYAVAENDACQAQELLMRAEGAQQWAKHHGKHRVVGFDGNAVAAVGDSRPLSVLREGPPLDIARALSSAADARDPANYHHSRNVAALAMLLARSNGLDPEHVRRIEVAAMLHDVGKIALPDAMLGGRTLPFRERRRAEEHAALGGRLVAALGVDGVGDWVRAHHERWDGNGYPDGLAAAEIPMEARIIALADAYDGMTTGKRYGAPMSKAAALQEIDLGIGVRFDPDLAELFIQVVGTTEALGWSDEWTAA